MSKGGTGKKRLTVMVSSTVYGIEEMLDQVYALLNGFGYEVWMSHKGTVPIYPDKTAFESCLLAVERCDLFLAIITPQYGSGVVDGDLGITHQELLKAIEKNRPRWVLAHAFIPFARSLFMKLGCKKAAEREELFKKLGYETKEDFKKLRNREKTVLDDFRVIDMYDAAIRHDISVHMDRKGNWVQKFSRPQDATLFATAQFSRYSEVEQFLKEHFSTPARVKQGIQGGKR